MASTVEFRHGAIELLLLKAPDSEGKTWIAIRSYHDGYHAFPDVMLFNLSDDPHEQHDLAGARADLATGAMAMQD